MFFYCYFIYNYFRCCILIVVFYIFIFLKLEKMETVIYSTIYHLGKKIESELNKKVEINTIKQIILNEKIDN